jgi:ribosomal protein L40E
MAKKKKSGSKKKAVEFKVCSKCSTENPISAKSCKSCDKSRFEPDWVKAHRPLNRQFSVQITASNPQFGDVEERITLNKWWPGGRATFHLPKVGQWEKVVEIINGDLGPKLGWKTAATLVDSATKKGVASKSGKKDIAKLAKDHPDFLKELIAAINPDKFSKQDFSNVVETLGQISDVLTNANAGFREAYLAIVKKLPKQKQRALEDLALLLEGWSLNVVTNVAQQVQARLETIDLFENQIGNARTFEILGDNSIHRILERAMWLISEEYWLLHSNKTLRVQIGDEMSKKDKKRYGKKRPDFVCGTVGNRLIILELKRPGHKLDIEDLNQLETYLAVAKKYYTASSCRGYLIGSSIDDELERRLEFRKGSEILFYANVIDSTKKRYHEFLKTLDD